MPEETGPKGPSEALIQAIVELKSRILSWEAEGYAEHLLECWRTSLLDARDDQLETAYQSRWNTLYSIDAMLEHAVMHPIRHLFQLEELMRED